MHGFNALHYTVLRSMWCYTEKYTTGKTKQINRFVASVVYFILKSLNLKIQSIVISPECKIFQWCCVHSELEKKLIFFTIIYEFCSDFPRNCMFHVHSASCF